MFKLWACLLDPLNPHSAIYRNKMKSKICDELLVSVPQTHLLRMLVCKSFINSSIFIWWNLMRIKAELHYNANARFQISLKPQDSFGEFNKKILDLQEVQDIFRKHHQGGISWNWSSLTICHSLTSTVTFLILIGYEALSLTVAMVIVSEWQIVSDDKFHEMPPRPSYNCFE